MVTAGACSHRSGTDAEAVTEIREHLQEQLLRHDHGMMLDQRHEQEHQWRLLKA